jgi:flagellar hook-associated protein 1 FlgK
MSLSAALNTAVIGLQTLQSQTRLVSGNVSNAQNPDYSRKVASITTFAANGLPGASLIASVTRVAAPELQQDLLKSAADYGRLEQQLDYAKSLAEIMDATNVTGAQPTLVAMMTRFEETWKQLEATPENNDLKAQVVQRGVEMTTEIRRLNGLQSELQNRAQQNLREDVYEINASTVEIAKLNNKIAAQNASGAPIGDLEDLRDAEIAKLADKVGLRTIQNDRGEVFVYTEGGVQLVGTTPQQFEYQATAVAPATPGIYLLNSTLDVTGGFLDGSIRASIDYLDTTAVGLASTDPNVATLQKFFNQLDSFARNLADVVNEAYDSTGVNVFFDFIAPATAGQEAGFIQVEAGLQGTPSTLDATTAGDVQQAMRNRSLYANEIQRTTTAAAGAIAGPPASYAVTADPNGLAIANVNIFGLINGILAYTARTADVNAENRDTAERLGHSLDQKLRNLTGVNIDDELAQLQLLQNNYAALANVMNTVTQMFDQLVNIGR